MIQLSIRPLTQPVCGAAVGLSMLLGLGATLAHPVQAQTVCSNGTEQATFTTPSYQLTVCQNDNALVMVSQPTTEGGELFRMPAFYDPETQVFGAVRTIPNPGAAYSYDLNPAITTVYYVQSDRLYVLENGRLVVNEAVIRP